MVPLDCGWEECVPGYIFGPTVRLYYLLHYVTEGEGRFLKNGTWHTVQAGDMFVIHPREITTYQGSIEHPWTYIWVSFQSPAVPEFLDTPVIRQPPVRKVMERLREQVENDPQDGRIFSLVYELLWRLSSGVSVQPDKHNSYAAYAKAYLDTAYMRRVTIGEIARNLHIDRRYLTNLFRETYGKPPQTYLMQLRLNQARDFLNQGYSVTEAAALAGFSDLSNFSRQYKQYFDCSPSRDMTPQEH